MKYAKVEVEIAVEDKDDAVNIVDDLIFYALNHGRYEDIGLGTIRLVEEKPIAVDEDGVPVWASVGSEA